MPNCGKLYNYYYSRAKRRDFLRLFESQIDYLLNLLLLLRVQHRDPMFTAPQKLQD
jgi:hypothetical protein